MSKICSLDLFEPTQETINNFCNESLPQALTLARNVAFITTASLALANCTVGAASKITINIDDFSIYKVQNYQFKDSNLKDLNNVLFELDNTVISLLNNSNKSSAKYYELGDYAGNQINIQFRKEDFISVIEKQKELNTSLKNLKEKTELSPSARNYIIDKFNLWEADTKRIVNDLENLSSGKPISLFADYRQHFYPFDPTIKPHVHYDLSINDNNIVTYGQLTLPDSHETFFEGTLNQKRLDIYKTQLYLRDLDNSMKRLKK